MRIGGMVALSYLRVNFVRPIGVVLTKIEIGYSSRGEKKLVDWVLSGSKMFWSLARKLIGDNTPLIGLFYYWK